MCKKLQVFVSSTYLDLIDERQEAVEGILRAGHIPAGMELFIPANKNQWTIIEKWIKESDILMLILGGKYGSIEPRSGKSYTQLEYEFALKNGIPVFAVVLNEQYLANKKSLNINLKVYEHEVDSHNIDKYATFKELVTSNLVSFVQDINQISTEVTLALNEFMKNDEKEYNFKGWIRGTKKFKDLLQVENGKNKILELDESLLDKIIILIEEGNFISQIETIALQRSYVHEGREIEELLYFAEKPSTHFYNKDVQRLFEKIIEKLNKYFYFISVNFFTLRGTLGDRKYLYPDLNDNFGFVDDEKRLKYQKYYKELNDITNETIEEIKNFVRHSRFVLYN